MNDSSKIVAFIPARSGSKRIPNKNIRLLGGHPMIAYSVCSALESEVFTNVFCITDSALYGEVAEHYGAEVPSLRPLATAQDQSADIDWVEWITRELDNKGLSFDAFAILRPTSPFRSRTTLQRAWNLFRNQEGVDSLRAVEPCSQHPGKMWVVKESRMHPVLPFEIEGVPWHSNQYAKLPSIYVQNASLEMVWRDTVVKQKSISGNTIMPFFTSADEGFDINSEYDFKIAEMKLESGEVSNCEIMMDSFKF